MRRKILIGMMVLGLISTTTNVYALGNATVEFTGESQIHVGETFTIDMTVTNVEGTYDGIVSLGGNLSFDHTKLEYISAKEVEAPYVFQINEDYNYKLAGLDFTLDNGIKTTTTVFEFTFKALEIGDTTITLDHYKLTDSKDYVDTTVISKVVTIEESVMEEKTIEEPYVEETMEPLMNHTEVLEIENTSEKITPISNYSEQKSQTKEEARKDTKSIEQEIEEHIEAMNAKTTTSIEENIFNRIQKVVNNLLKSIQKLLQ